MTTYSNPIPMPSQSTTNGEEPKKQKHNRRETIERALKYLYEFRRNQITKIPEYRPANDPEADWQRITDEILYSIERRLQLDGYHFASENLIVKVIKSDFSPSYHPVRDFFLQLPTHDGRDHIKELCDTVSTTAGDDRFYRYFRKWLVACVANIFITNRCANHMCFILVGGQGTFKSTWINNLYPPGLEDYCFDGDIDPENKDSLIRTTENFLINMDDYFADISAKKVNTLKGFITLDTVKVRRPYGRFDEIAPKICSFVGSTNESQFLYDATGSRRFLPFEITHIDIEAAKSIDMRKVYAQAYHLFRKGERYWISREEQQELEEHNEQFKIQSFEFDMVSKYLKVPSDPDKAREFWTTGEILNFLKAYTNERIGIKRLGQALQIAGFERTAKKINNKTIKGYYVDPIYFTDTEVRKKGGGDAPF